ncbi:carbohydrate kinase [Aurantimonas sp. VKM B-3413]|uniref:carbohydrate kinase family protein n=1 Tax=Aurantimonas sp. VKM B-3413 TaxID=2779401 RepID=UPI001E4F0464|nr:carbohydrate kinase [Aurantimonas sp. VKM B-3413]MCB8838958.1 carbohydrate kinase [Aurantimonas sp. VKM B-3413]
MFLSCGDCLFDLFASEGEDVAEVALGGRIGGSPLNVALGLARLGHPVGYFTKMSGDLFGRKIRAFMEREGIDQRFLVRTERNTTLAMVSLSGEGSAAYSFYIEGTADRSIEPDEVPATLPQELQAIHLASYSTVTEPTASALLRLVRQESDRRFISYDPNIRASIEPDLDVWRAKVGELVPLAALVKASEEDLDQLYPGRSIDSVLQDWVAAGAAMAVVTKGERGASALSAGGVAAAVDGQRIVVADTVGAGDTFQAALLAGLKERGALSREALQAADRPQIEALLDFAVRAAAVTCSRRGADLPRRGDLGLPPLA